VSHTISGGPCALQQRPTAVRCDETAYAPSNAGPGESRAKLQFAPHRLACPCATQSNGTRLKRRHAEEARHSPLGRLRARQELWRVPRSRHCYASKRMPTRAFMLPALFVSGRPITPQLTTRTRARGFSQPLAGTPGTRILNLAAYAVRSAATAYQALGSKEVRAAQRSRDRSRSPLSPSRRRL